MTPETSSHLADEPNRLDTDGADQAALRRFRARLLCWFDKEKRDLPWRRRKDAYAIWLSEVMLQQTRVEVVSDRFVEFLRRFPTVKDLAVAGEEEVLSLWSGLGYYARARALHRGARLVCDAHAGEFPRIIEEARRIPGVGAYTAAAVLSIAYGCPHAVVDGNVARVLARLFRLDPPGAMPARLARIADRMLNARRPGDHNQAMMELGALVCLPLRPRCGECPVSVHCRACLEEAVGSYPVPRERRPPVDLAFRLLLLRDGKGRLLLERGRWRFLTGLWLPPILSGPDGGRYEGGAALAPLGSFRHTITHHRILFEVFRGRAPRGIVREAAGESMLTGDEALGSLGRSAVLTKALRLEARAAPAAPGRTRPRC